MSPAVIGVSLIVLAAASLLYFAQDAVHFKNRQDCEAAGALWEPAGGALGLCWKGSKGAPIAFLGTLAASAALVGAGAAIVFLVPGPKPEPQLVRIAAV